MDPLTAIATALIAGATAAVSGVASKAVTDAYEGLRKLLATAYGFASAALLHSDPKDPTYQKAVRAEFEKKATIANDPAVLQLTQALQEALTKEPKQKLDQYAIDVKIIESDKKIIIDHVRGGVQSDHIKAKDDVILSNISLVNP